MAFIVNSQKKQTLFGFSLPSDWNIDTHEWPKDKRFFEQLQAQNRSLQLQWNWTRKEDATTEEKTPNKTQEQQPSTSK